ncbi:hypothetical protein Ae406Ps2_6465 [Pseudonocardia sp. Ae406_Ps2]|nr:hypothetical protein Ae406Ps2_6465 [Pseudonocardia sp. Ae406_Ps2]
MARQPPWPRSTTVVCSGSGGGSGSQSGGTGAMPGVIAGRSVSTRASRASPRQL